MAGVVSRHAPMEHGGEKRLPCHPAIRMPTPDGKCKRIVLLICSVMGQLRGEAPSIAGGKGEASPGNAGGFKNVKRFHLPPSPRN